MTATTQSAVPTAISFGSITTLAILARFRIRTANGNEKRPKIHISVNNIARPVNNFSAANSSGWTNLKVRNRWLQYNGR